MIFFTANGHLKWPVLFEQQDTINHCFLIINSTLMVCCSLIAFISVYRFTNQVPEIYVFMHICLWNCLPQFMCHSEWLGCMDQYLVSTASSFKISQIYTLLNHGDLGRIAFISEICDFKCEQSKFWWDQFIFKLLHCTT